MPTLLAPYDPLEQYGLDRSSLDLSGRRFLLVTLPFGAFGSALRKALLDIGADGVDRMIFNGGDATSWLHKGRVTFRRSSAEWPDYLRKLSADYTDIIIFGESGPYNRAVIELSGQISARVWVLENGYFRPDWITLERNGVNATSQLPRNAEGYGEPVPEVPTSYTVGRILPYHVINITLYHVMQVLGSAFYPRYSNPYTISVGQQCWGHICRYLRMTFRNSRSLDVGQLRMKGPYFIVCLQREGDNQLVRYSDFSDNVSFLRKVLTSFAGHADVGARLVVKNHPLDPGITDFEKVIDEMAARYGLKGRVEFWDGGNLAELCRSSQGMVVNNSSAALSALGFGTPVKVLGRAFFDFEGMTDQKSLELFWKSPQLPEASLFKRFRSHVLAKAQINGNFHEPRSRTYTAKAVAAFLSQRTV